MSCEKTLKICEACGKEYTGGPFCHYCMECRRQKIKEGLAKKKNEAERSTGNRQ